MEEAGEVTTGGAHFRDVVVRFWSPRTLAAAAIGASNWSAMLLGITVASVLGGLLFYSCAWGISEPYPDFSPLYTELIFLPRGVALFAFVLTVTALPLAWGMFVQRREESEIERRRRVLQARVILLLPLACIAPVVAWLPFCLLASIADPAIAINSGKPAWTTWMFWRIVGSPVCLFAFLPLAGWHAMRAILCVDDILLRSVCAACGYSLAGIDAQRCPECGHAHEFSQPIA